MEVLSIVLLCLLVVVLSLTLSLIFCLFLVAVRELRASEPAPRRVGQRPPKPAD